MIIKPSKEPLGEWQSPGKALSEVYDKHPILWGVPVAGLVVGYKNGGIVGSLVGGTLAAGGLYVVTQLMK